MEVFTVIELFFSFFLKGTDRLESTPKNFLYDQEPILKHYGKEH